MPQSANNHVENENRRSQPRLTADCTALMRLSEALTFRCRVRDLSLGGAQAVCAARYALLIEPRLARGFRRMREPEISIALPWAGGARSLASRCALMYRLRDDEDRMRLGLRFLDLDDQAHLLLRHFMAAAG